ALNRERLSLVAADPSERLSGAARLQTLFDHGREIGENGDDSLADDVLDQIAPMRSDVADRRARAALFRLEAPREVGRLEQPVLQIRPMDVVHRPDLAGGDHLARLLYQRIAAVVERHRMDDTRVAGGLPEAQSLIA